MAKKIVKYMHTIHFRPAQYRDGEQICYAGKYGVARFAESLRQIRSEQKKSNVWRVKQGFNPVENFGYVRLTIDV